MIFEELKKMQGKVLKALRHSGSYVQRDMKGRDRFYRKIKELEDETDVMQHEITTFTVALMQAGGASKAQSDRAYGFVRAADELESIADYVRSFSGYMHRLDKHELDFSDDAWRDLMTYHQEVVNFFSLVCKTFNDQDYSSTKEIYSEASRLNDLADEVRKAHLERMKSGACNALPALTFSDMAVALRRIKNHTVNLHEAIISEQAQAA
jgi:phosphate:Na+ symporter